MNAPTSNLDRASLRAMLAVERDLRRGTSDPAHTSPRRPGGERADSGIPRARAGRD